MKIHVSLNPEIIADNEKTVCSFEEALELLRKRDSNEEKRIIVHGGTYYGTSLKLTDLDSGVSVEAAGGEKPVLSGSVIISDWKKDEKTGWFSAKAPKVGDNFSDFRLLITTDGRYLKKARYPLEGNFKHNTVFTAATWNGSDENGWQRALLDDELNHFEYFKEDIPDDFDDVSAEIQVYHSWNESYCKIKKHDRKNRTFWLTPNCTYPPGVWKRSFAVYNTKDGMLEDGRWYCDRNTGTIYYRPLPGEDVKNFSCFVPVTTKVIDIEEGTRDITLKGLTITGATTPVRNEQYRHPCQRGGAGFGNMEQDGAIFGKKLDNIKIEDCEIYNTGGYGIMIRGEGLYVRRCNIHECGAGGIGISSSNSITKETRDSKKWSCVEDCRIENIGLDYYGAPGIFSDSAMLRRNYVARTPYTNILANGDYCVVEDNVCIDPMLKLNDGACIYMHMNTGCIVRKNICINNNFINHKNTDSMDYDNILVWGIYLDALTDDFEIYENYIRGFSWPVIDARRGSTNRWHHNTMEYTPKEGSENVMVIRFPEDKTMLFDHNVARCDNIIIIANEEYFKEERDMKYNTFICDKLAFQSYNTDVHKSDLSVEYELTDKNTKVGYSHKDK